MFSEHEDPMISARSPRIGLSLGSNGGCVEREIDVRWGHILKELWKIVENYGKLWKIVENCGKIANVLWKIMDIS